MPESCLVGRRGQRLPAADAQPRPGAPRHRGHLPRLAQCAFDDAAAYAAQRVQFGKPIGSFQLIQLKLTDMAIKLENMRNFVYKTSWMVDQGSPCSSQGALCKRYVAMAGFEVADDAMQVFGGVGVTPGTRVSRLA